MATPTSHHLNSYHYTPAPTTSQSCITVTPGPHGYVPLEACNAQWPYSPSFTAAVAFAVLFGILTFAHLVLAILHRKPFCWVIIMAAAWELTAFILRSLGSHNQQNGAYSLAQQLFFLLAPLWINAFVYMTAGRLIYTLHPEKKVWGFKAVSMGKYFVWLDVVSFLVQATGGLMLSPGDSAKTQNIGKTVYMSGIGVQQFFILLFSALIVRFQLDALKLEREGRLGSGSGKGYRWWKLLTYTLYAVLALITMRIAFRLAEFAGGINPQVNPLPYTEVYPLSLDAFPMMLALLLLAVVHPGLVLQGPESQLPSRKEKKAEKKARKEEKKRQREAEKTGVYMDKAYAAAYIRTSEERLMSEDVEMGHVERRADEVARF